MKLIRMRVILRKFQLVWMLISMIRSR